MFSYNAHLRAGLAPFIEFIGRLNEVVIICVLIRNNLLIFTEMRQVLVLLTIIPFVHLQNDYYANSPNVKVIH